MCAITNLISTYGYGDNQDGSIGVRIYPISQIYSGFYRLIDGRLYYQGGNGSYWSLTLSNSTGAYKLGIDEISVRFSSMSGKTEGLALRCATLLTS